MMPLLRQATFVWVAALAALLGGCTDLLTETTSAGAGIAAADLTRGATRNAGIITGVGLGVHAGFMAGLRYTERKVHQTEQDRIAAVAGGLPAGAVAPWGVVHDIPIEANEHGEVAVSRLIGGPGIDCKEIVFSVDHTEKTGVRQEFYTATVCRDGERWKWATAEPATGRWGGLQ